MLKIPAVIVVAVAAAFGGLVAAANAGGGRGLSSGAGSVSSGGSHSVRGYIKRDGIYVEPHRATNPNQTKLDNWSTKGNVNPYTGKPGTKLP